MLPRVLNTIFFNFSNIPFPLQLKISSIQIVVLTSFVELSNVGIKRVDCIIIIKAALSLKVNTNINDERSSVNNFKMSKY